MRAHNWKAYHEFIAIALCFVKSKVEATRERREIQKEKNTNTYIKQQNKTINETMHWSRSNGMRMPSSNYIQSNEHDAYGNFVQKLKKQFMWPPNDTTMRMNPLHLGDREAGRVRKRKCSMKIWKLLRVLLLLSSRVCVWQQLAMIVRVYQLRNLSPRVHPMKINFHGKIENMHRNRVEIIKKM